MHQKYEEEPLKLTKLYFRKCSLTIINKFEGGEFNNDHRFQSFMVFRTFSIFAVYKKWKCAQLMAH